MTLLNELLNELPLLLLLLLTAAGAIFVKDLISAVLILGSYSFFLALVWAWLGAPDVAFVEAVVGAGLATVFFLLTLFSTDPKDTHYARPRPQLAAVVMLPVLGALLLFAAADLPEFGDPCPRTIWRTAWPTRARPTSLRRC